MLQLVNIIFGHMTHLFPLTLTQILHEHFLSELKRGCTKKHNNTYKLLVMSQGWFTWGPKSQFTRGQSV